MLFTPSVTRQKLRGAGFTDRSLDQMDRLRRTKRDLERWNGKHCRWSRAQRPPSKIARSHLLEASSRAASSAARCAAASLDTAETSASSAA